MRGEAKQKPIARLNNHDKVTIWVISPLIVVLNMSNQCKRLTFPSHIPSQCNDSSPSPQSAALNLHYDRLHEEVAHDIGHFNTALHTMAYIGLVLPPLLVLACALAELLSLRYEKDLQLKARESGKNLSEMLVPTPRAGLPSASHLRCVHVLGCQFCSVIISQLCLVVPKSRLGPIPVTDHTSRLA